MSSSVKLARQVFCGGSYRLLESCSVLSYTGLRPGIVKPSAATPCLPPQYYTPRVHFSIGSSQFGPGADKKYKAKEDVEEAAENAKNRKKRILMGGLAGGLVVGSILGLKAATSDKNKPQISNDSMTKEYLLESPPPPFPPARTIRNPADNTGLKITLFQYQTCPFCCKARAFLDYFGLSYDVVEVNSVLRTQVKWSKYKKVPILVVESQGKAMQVNDSSVILSVMFSKLSDPSAKLEDILDCYPTIRYNDEDGKEKMEIQNKYFLMYNEAKVSRTKEDIVEERKWRKWADDVLVHTLSPNVYRSPGEALAAFKWFDEVGRWGELFAAWERYLVIYVGALAMWLIGKRLKKRHNLKDDVRASLFDECNFWMKSLRQKGTPFMGGQSPNLADISVFGVLSAIEGCEAFQDARNQTKIGDWFDRMKEVVKAKAGGSILQG